MTCSPSLKMALSIGIRNSISLLSAIQATRSLTFTLVGLAPTEHTSFCWTHCRTAEFLRSGLKPWHFVDEPSQFATKFKRWFAYTPSAIGLLIASFLSLATVWCARFYQAEPVPVVGTTKAQSLFA
jgi:hypothetical protein